ncbi:hypothetical protein GGI12_000813 [Dipsacomyces acuminosporus]|nr:hypothetical protein GGI12_000813 [Dipsacomyces acuminosporus]
MSEPSSQTNSVMSKRLGRSKPKRAQQSDGQQRQLVQQAQGRRRAAVKESMRTKAQFDNLSLRWQEKLLEPVSETLLKQAARYLTPGDYESITSERVSGDLCGYPLCNKKTKKVTQAFHISLTRRKLFDIGEQGNYCSSRCMLGSRFYKQQLSEDPLYLRDRNMKLDIDIIPLTAEKDVPEEPAEPTPVETASGHHESSGKELAKWYMESLMAKMKIPNAVAAANPLQIVEHDTQKGEFGVSEAEGRLQFADIEGFEPEVDSLRIKKAVRHAVRISPKQNSAVAGDKRVRWKDESRSSKDSSPSFAARDGVSDSQEVLGADESQSGGASSDADSLYSSNSDDEESSDMDDGAGNDGNYFAGVFSAENSRSRPAMSFFGRMWTMVDRAVSGRTREYLSDLRISQSADGLLNSAGEYQVALGDRAMAMRHGMLLDSVTRELFDIQGSLHVDLSLDHEIRLLISTLLLNSNMVVFNKPELRVLCITFLMALAQSMDSLKQELDDIEVSQRLDTLLQELHVERSMLSMISKRFHESF